MTGVSVEHIKRITFSLLPLHEKIEIINRGRPTPDIYVHQTQLNPNKKCLKSFNHEWYNKIKWLCGCELTNALFCFPCLLFGGDTVWTQNGFRSIAKMKEKTEKHQNSRRHIANMISLSLLSQVNISQQISDDRMCESLYNEQVKENREVLSKIIDCVKYSGEFELSLRGDNESESGFKGLINFIANFDSSLRKHLESSVFEETSVQNELLQSMLEVCQDHIVSEIEEASYVTVMTEDASEVSEDIQTVVVFRYELHGVVCERFWGFFNSENTEGVFECLVTEIHKVLKNGSNKLIAQAYDKASEVVDEPLHYKIQKIYPHAHFIHSYAHELNSVMKHIASSIKSVRVFLANLAGLGTFFSKSSQRLAILNKHNVTDSNKSFNNFSIKTIYETKNNLINCFEELQSLQTTNKTIQLATGFLNLLKNESFSFWLEVFDKIMTHVQILNEEILLRGVSVSNIQNALHKFYQEVSKICSSVSFEAAGGSKILECKEVCSRVCEEAKHRFAFTYHLTAAALFNQENFDSFHKDLPAVEISETCKAFPGVMEDKLKAELQIFYSQKEFHNYSGLLELLNALTHGGSLASVFSEMLKVIRILVTIPMHTPEPGRCFSTLRKAKSCLRSAVSHDRLTALAMVAVEKKMMSQIANFNDKGARLGSKVYFFCGEHFNTPSQITEYSQYF